MSLGNSLVEPPSHMQSTVDQNVLKGLMTIFLNTPNFAFTFKQLRDLRKTGIILALVKSPILVSNFILKFLESFTVKYQETGRI